MKIKGQVSLEYIFIVAIALGILVPGTIIFMNYTQDSTTQVASEQINKIGNKIINQARDIYTIGEDSWVTLDMNIPQPVTNMSINDNELVIHYTTESGETSAVFFSSVPIQGNPDISPGFTKLKILSVGDAVNITKVT